MTYTEKTERMVQMVKDTGFNIWAMLGLYRKRSKLKPQIPDDVVQGVCMEYLSKQGKIRSDFPYFLTILEKKSHAYFAKQNIDEHERIKREPVKLKITIG